MSLDGRFITQGIAGLFSLSPERGEGWGEGWFPKN
jgi:hypothetical protein